MSRAPTAPLLNGHRYYVRPTYGCWSIFDRQRSGEPVSDYTDLGLAEIECRRLNRNTCPICQREQLADDGGCPKCSPKAAEDPERWDGMG